MTVKVYHSLDESLRQNWQNLWEECTSSHFFNSPAWYLACLKTFEYSQTVILACFNNSQLIGVLPLVKTKKQGISTYASPGSPYLDRSTILLIKDNPKIAAKLIKELSKLGNFYLINIDNFLVDGLSKSNPKLKAVESSVCPYLPLSPDPYRYIRLKLRKRILKTIKDGQGSFKYKKYSGLTDELLKKIIEIESQSPKVSKHKDIFSDPLLSEFYTNLNKLDGKSFTVHMLFYKGEPICFKYGFMTKNIYHSCNTAYKTIYGDFSPGKIITFLMLNELAKIGIETLDFSRGDTPLKREFTPHTYKQYSLFYSTDRLTLLWWEALDALFRFLKNHPNLFEKIRIGKRILKKNLINLNSIFFRNQVSLKEI